MIGSSGNDEEAEYGSTVCTGDEVERRHGTEDAEGYKMLHAGGDGRSNGVGIIVNVEISKEVVRVEFLDWEQGTGKGENWWRCRGGTGWRSQARSSRRATKSPTGADGTRQSSTYWWCGNSSSGG